MAKADEMLVTHSYYAKIPASMMAAGTIPIQAVVLDANGNETTAVQTINISVASIQPLVVQVVPINIDGKTESTANLGNGFGFYHGALPGPPSPNQIDCGAGFVKQSNTGSSRDAFGANQYTRVSNCPPVAARRRMAQVAEPNASPSPHIYLQPLPGDQLALHTFATILPESMKITGSFTDLGSIFHETEPGPVLFEGLRADGSVLFAVNGPLLVIHTGDIYGNSHLNIPISATQNAELAGLRVTYLGRSITQMALPVGPFTATVVRLDAQRLRVTFDGTHFKDLIVRGSTADYGANSIYSDGTTHSTGIAYIGTDTAYAYVDFNDGVKTVARKVKIPIQDH